MTGGSSVGCADTATGGRSTGGRDVGCSARDERHHGMATAAQKMTITAFWRQPRPRLRGVQRFARPTIQLTRRFRTLPETGVFAHPAVRLAVSIDRRAPA